MAMWGITYILTFTALKYYSAFSIVAIRVFIASFLLFIISLIMKKLQRIQKKHIKYFLFMGILDPFGYFLLESYGIKYSTPTISAIMVSLIPLLIPIAAFFVVKEKVSLINFIGIIISFFGVLMILIKNDFSLIVSSLGMIFLISAILVSIASIMLIKKIMSIYNEYTVMTYLNITSSIYFIPIFLIYEIPVIADVTLTSELVINLLLLSFLGSTLAFLFYLKGLKEIGVTKTNIFVNLIPVFTAIFSYFLLDERLSVKMIIGILIVIFGLIITQIKFTKNIFKKQL